MALSRDVAPAPWCCCCTLLLEAAAAQLCTYRTTTTILLFYLLCSHRLFLPNDISTSFVYLDSSTKRHVRTRNMWSRNTSVRPTLLDRKAENKKFFPIVVLKPTQGSGFSCSVPQSARTAKRTCFSRTTLHRRYDSSPHRTWVSTQLG